VKQGISSGAAGYIVDYVTSISQKHQADVLVVDWENNTHGAVFGIAVYRSIDLRFVPNAVKYLVAQSS
jgi:prephenate dehydratase